MAIIKEGIMAEYKLNIYLLKIKECFFNEEAPPDLDYCKSNNPYKAKYGQDLQDQIKKCFMLSMYQCIMHMLEHIVQKSPLFKGTRSYLRILNDGRISSERIVTDTLKLYDCMLRIHKAKGVVLQNIGNRSHKVASTEESHGKRGSKCLRKIGMYDYGNVFVHDARTEKIENAKKRNIIKQDNSKESDIVALKESII